MSDQGKIWDKIHEKYHNAGWIDNPTIFAKEVIKFFPKEGNVLELGVGQGQDSRFFALNGYDIVGLDISETGLQYANEKLLQDDKKKISYLKFDISKTLQFVDETFDVVYSHLALHYFNKETTENIFNEIYRVLKPGGIFAALFNSVNDPEYGQGEIIEDDFYLFNGEIQKRFFSTESVREFGKKFEIIVSDEEGDTYKDRATSTTNLVRFIGRKNM